MTRKNCYSAVVLVLIAAVTFSCRTNDSGPSADVYICGYTGSLVTPNAVYWKNGTPTQLVNPGGVPSEALDILVVGTDVYVVGNLFDSSWQAVYWKNGAMNTLSDSSSEATAIASNGADIFIAGSNKGRAGYWKNGTFTSFAEGTVATDVAVAGSDVYVVGMQEYATADEAPPGFTPYFWKNGVLTALSGSGGPLHVAVGSSGVFVCGNILTEYLNNGTETSLSGALDLTNVAISGADVYVLGIGNDGPGSAGYAAYWKNGVISKVANGPAGLSGIQVSGADVYLIGSSGFSTTAVYWKRCQQHAAVRRCVLVCNWLVRRGAINNLSEGLLWRRFASPAGVLAIPIAKIGMQDSVVYKYKIHNAKRAPLLIKQVKASCGCIVSTYSQGPIPQNEFREVSVLFRPVKTGPVLNDIVVETNDSNKPFLSFRLTGRVI